MLRLGRGFDGERVGLGELLKHADGAFMFIH